jgi:hypothetical protein
VAVAVLLLTGGATSIIICITVLAGRPLREIIATMPLLPEQWVTLDAPGDYILHGENAGFSRKTATSRPTRSISRAYSRSARGPSSPRSARRYS